MPSGEIVSERRKQMMLGRRELIEHCHSQAVRDGLDRPIVVVADLADDAGRSYAVSLLGEKAVEDRAAFYKESGHDPILIQARDRPDNPDPRSNGFAVLDKTARENLFAVVVIGDGGISWAAFPIVG